MISTTKTALFMSIGMACFSTHSMDTLSIASSGDSSGTEDVSAKTQFNSIPKDMKRTILRKAMTGESYATILQRIAQWRSVSKEWEKLLREENLLYHFFLNGITPEDNEAKAIVQDYFAQYLKKVVAKKKHTYIESQLLKLLLTDSWTYAEVYNVLVETPEARFNDENIDQELIRLLPALHIYLTVTAPEEDLAKASAIFMEKILSVVMVGMHRDSFKQAFINAINRALPYAEGDRLLVIQNLANNIQECTSDEVCTADGTEQLSYAVLAHALGLSASLTDPVLIAQRMKEVLHLDAPSLFEMVQRSCALTHSQEAFLKDVLKGNITALQENYAAAREPVLIDLALLIALKSGYEDCTLCLLTKELKKKRSLHALTSLLIVNYQALTRSRELCEAIAAYYVEETAHFPPGVFPMAMTGLISSAATQEELLQACAMVTIYFGGQEAATCVPKEWFIACYTQDHEAIRNSFPDFEPQPLRFVMVGAGLQMCITNKLYSSIKAIRGNQIGAMLAASDIFKSLYENDPLLDEALLGCSGSVKAQFDKFCSRAKRKDFVRKEAVRDFLQTLNLPDAAQALVDAALEGNEPKVKSLLSVQQDPYVIDLALLAALAGNHSSLTRLLIAQVPVVEAESVEEELHISLLSWQLRLAFYHKDKESSLELLAKLMQHTTHSRTFYSNVAKSIIITLEELEEYDCDYFVFTCMTLFPQDEIKKITFSFWRPRRECRNCLNWLIACYNSAYSYCTGEASSASFKKWLVACWREDLKTFHEQFPAWALDWFDYQWTDLYLDNTRPQLIFIIAAWACSTGRNKLVEALVTKMYLCDNPIWLPSEIEELLMIARENKQVAIANYIGGLLAG